MEKGHPRLRAYSIGLRILVPCARVRAVLFGDNPGISYADSTPSLLRNDLRPTFPFLHRTHTSPAFYCYLFANVFYIVLVI